MTTIDSVYTQRNELAVAFAKAALAAGWKAGRGIDSKADPEWANVVYVDLPDGRQVSWHMSPDCVPLLDGLPQYVGTWDGTFIGRETGWSRGIEPVVQQKDPTDPGNDVDVLREHVRHLERRVRQLHAQQAEPLNLRDPAVQKRLATQWGYVPAAQAEPVEPVATLIAQRNDILRMAREAGLPFGQRGAILLWDKELARFAELVDAAKDAEHQQTLALQQRSYEREIQLEVEAEREACAALLEANGMQCGEESLSRLILETNAAAIRARNP